MKFSYSTLLRSCFINFGFSELTLVMKNSKFSHILPFKASKCFPKKSSIVDKKPFVPIPLIPNDAKALKKSLK